MKKYYCEASKKQLEKPTEPKYMFCSKAKTIVFAENENEALVKAAKAFDAKYFGTGVILGKIEITGSYELPVDWSYGYAEDYKSGATEELGDLVGNNVIR